MYKNLKFEYENNLVCVSLQPWKMIPCNKNDESKSNNEKLFQASQEKYKCNVDQLRKVVFSTDE